MDDIGRYFVSIAAAAIICAIIRRMLEKKGTVGSVGKLLTGVFMTVTVLSPLINFSFDPTFKIADEYQKQAQTAIDEGEKITSDMLRESISESLEAYVLKKAKAYGAEVQVEIILSEDPYPAPQKIRISGQVAPYAKNRIKQVITDELGIKEEDQIWI